jgi:hypothetical protein
MHLNRSYHDFQNWSFLILIAALAMSGCSKIKQVELDKTVTMAFEVDLQPGDPTEVNLEEIVDFATGNLAEYKSSIKSYKIRNVRYRIWEFWTDGVESDVMLNGTIGFSSKTAAQNGVVHTLTDLSLLESSTSEAYTNFSFGAADQKKLEQYLLGTNGLKIRAERYHLIRTGSFQTADRR